MKYKLSDLLPVINQTLESGGTFTLPVTGTSMLPLLREKRDSVTLKKAALPLKKGDLPLYRRADGAFVLHRVIGRDDRGYVLCGDNQFDLERGIADTNIIGITTGITRGKHEFSVNAPLYRAYVRLWTALVGVRYPLRRLRRSAKVTDESAAEGFYQPKPCVSYTLKLLRAALDGTEPPSVPDDVDMADVLRLARSHRVANTAAYAVLKLPVDESVKKAFQTELFRVVQRQAVQAAALKAIEERFTEAKIKFCVLKGAALSALYPSADMRFSLDMDIWVDSENVSTAEQILKGLGYSQEGERTTKDIAFVKKPALTVELHFDLNFETDLTHDYFQQLPLRLVPSPDNPYCLRMTNEDLFVYVLGHTAHHFLTAGTGIRSVLDDYLLRQKLLSDGDTTVVDRELEAAGLTEFSRQLAALGDCWFAEGASTDTVRRMQKYIIESGVFGTESAFYVNSTVTQSKIGGSKALYVLERIFPSYTVMTALFPKLKKVPVLLPFCWAARWVKIFFNLKRVTGEITSVAAADKGIRYDRSDLFGKLGFH